MTRGEARRRDEGGGRYAFHVAEQMTPTAVAVFPELTRAESAAGTVLEGVLRGRMELYLILDRFALLGVTILDVHRLPD